ncbi:ubiquinone/menaquinone biosynthesis C-methyltransferase UbiE-like [Mercenaria mercenaria]|uniref:ubiquinone/menaquinone biosynthesis C-methyltransferase UbiE-like n=1 Tax=Mercenaria mercenaria TaxID=6596 RepID=UPI00234F29CE|nr:ubiquinone/menaquinone biosynthesis C-methyltransferase UbiE-like [Mercenaria mercenaria]
MILVKLREGQGSHQLQQFGNNAGCGTGNYAKAFVDMGVGQITILDASTGMLEKAKSKLADYMARGVVKEAIEAKMPPIPFPDESFDAVVFNLVLNHLDIDNPAFPNSVKTLKESVRILRPDGLIIISTVLTTTVSRIQWFSQLNMEITNRYNASVMPSLEQFEQMFEDAGIKCIQKINTLGADIIKNYYNLDDILDESLRAPRPYWTFATKEEVADVVQKVKALKAKGEYEKWVKEHDLTSTTGVVTIFFCKPN